MKYLTRILCFGLVFLLGACQSATSPNSESQTAGGNTSLSGAWESDAGIYYLDNDGSVTLPGNNNTEGLSWEKDNNTLKLVILPLGLKAAKTSQYTIQHQSNNRLSLKDDQGQTVVWQRKNKGIGKVQGVVIYRERMALPEDATLRLILSAADGKHLAAKIIPVKKQGNIPFSIPYLIKDTGKSSAAQLRAEILISGVPVLGTATPQRINLEGSQEIMLQRASAYGQDNKGEAPLKETYWRLATLGDKPVEVFPGMPEPHLIIREENSQAVGSDGCNNFFLPWKQSGQKIEFGQGGSTLRLCPQGMEQAGFMLKALGDADSWSISGSRLELKKKNAPVAVFQAVDL